MKWMIWDFDGTLAYHKRGLWNRSMHYCLERAVPELGLITERWRSITRI